MFWGVFFIMHHNTKQICQQTRAFAIQLEQIITLLLCVISENSADRDQTTHNPGIPDLGHMCFLPTLCKLRDLRKTSKHTHQTT